MYDRPFNDNSYEQFLSEGKITGTKCLKCGALALPPRPVCVACSGTKLEWFQFGGAGKLAAFTSIFVATPAMAKEGFNKNNPYVVGVIELDEGAKIVGRITGVNGKKPEGIKIGTPLKAEFIRSGTGADQKTSLSFKA